MTKNEKVRIDSVIKNHHRLFPIVGFDNHSTDRIRDKYIRYKINELYISPRMGNRNSTLSL
jgi:hypothetical protein